MGDISTIVKIVTLKLRMTTETEPGLADTMERFNKAYNHLSGIAAILRESSVAWDTRTFRASDRHHAAYHAVREQSCLPA